MPASPSDAITTDSDHSRRRSRAPSRVLGVEVPDEIICVECQGTCYRLTQRPADDPFESGDFVAYRCPDCAERFDMVLTDPEDD